MDPFHDKEPDKDCFRFLRLTHESIAKVGHSYLICSMPLLPSQCVIMKFSSLSSQLPGMDFLNISAVCHSL